VALGGRPGPAWYDGLPSSEAGRPKRPAGPRQSPASGEEALAAADVDRLARGHAPSDGEERREQSSKPGPAGRDRTPRDRGREAAEAVVGAGRDAPLHPRRSRWQRRRPMQPAQLDASIPNEPPGKRRVADGVKRRNSFLRDGTYCRTRGHAPSVGEEKADAVGIALPSLTQRALHVAEVRWWLQRSQRPACRAGSPTARELAPPGWRGGAVAAQLGA
jgi:hypothetical protein